MKKAILSKLNKDVLAARFEGLSSKLQEAMGPKVTVGLDIGANSVKMAQLRDTPTGTYLEDFAIEEIPVQTKEADRKALLANAIGNIVRDKKIVTERIVSVISGPEVVIRRIKVPKMTRAELQEGVKWEVKEFVPFSVDQAAIDFQVVGEVMEKDIKKLDIVAAAVEKAAIDKHLSVINNAGLKPSAIDILPLALWNSIKKSGLAKEDEIICLIDFGGENTSLSIIRDGSLEVTRDINIAGNSITKGLTAQLTTREGPISLSYEQAERIKIECGIPKEAGAEKIEGNIPLSQISVLMRPALERLLTEIQRLFDYYRVRSQGKEIDKVLLSGGSARLKGLKEFLFEGLDVPVEVVTLTNFQYDTKKLSPEVIAHSSPRLAVAVGLALGKGRGINLLPPKLKVSKQKTLEKVSVKAAAISLVIFLICTYGLIAIRTAIYRKNLAIQEATWSTLKPQQERFIQLVEVKKKASLSISVFQQLIEEEPLWSGILKEIGNIIPPDAVLRELSLEEKEGMRLLRFKGSIFATRATAEGILARFMSGLEDSPFFKKTNLISTQQETRIKDATGFEITCFLD